MSATTFLRRRNHAGDTCKSEEFPAATFGKAFCNFRYLGVAKNRRLTHHCHLILFPGESNRLRESSINELFASRKGGA